MGYSTPITTNVAKVYKLRLIMVHAELGLPGGKNVRTLNIQHMEGPNHPVKDRYQIYERGS